MSRELMEITRLRIEMQRRIEEGQLYGRAARTWERAEAWREATDARLREQAAVAEAKRLSAEIRELQRAARN